jgi:hypothetical protein
MILAHPASVRRANLAALLICCRSSPSSVMASTDGAEYRLGFLLGLVRRFMVLGKVFKNPPAEDLRAGGAGFRPVGRATEKNTALDVVHL